MAPEFSPMNSVGSVTYEEEREWGTILLLFFGVVLLVIGFGISRGDLTFYHSSMPFFIVGGLCLVPLIIKALVGFASAIPSIKK